jgi:mannose-1-phosphate guanylyltransferase
MVLHAIVLAGGSGTRFWPRSRAGLPKQFLKLGGQRTLIQATVDRLQGLVPHERVFVVTGEAHRSLVNEQLPELDPSNVLVEPERRDTAAAVALATALVARRAGDDAALAVLPSDHAIRPPERLRAALARAHERARGGAIVTFGIRPTEPSSAYGYLKRGRELAPGVALVERFEEKPDRATAARYVAGGRHAWNSGMFVFTAKTMKDELARHLPRTLEAVERIVAARETADADRVLRAEWAGLEKISIDYAVMERARSIELLDVDFEWSDVGSWTAAGEFFEKDERGNAIDSAPFVGIDARSCVVAGDGRLVAIVGLDDVVVVESKDALLVCKKDRAEDVKKVVAELERRGLSDLL